MNSTQIFGSVVVLISFLSAIAGIKYTNQMMMILFFPIALLGFVIIMIGSRQRKEEQSKQAAQEPAQSDQNPLPSSKIRITIMLVVIIAMAFVAYQLFGNVQEKIEEAAPPASQQQDNIIMGDTETPLQENECSDKTGLAKDACIMQIAATKAEKGEHKTGELCKEMSTEEFTFKCYLLFAAVNEDPYICNSIGIEELSTICIAVANRDTEECTKLENTELRDSCVEEVENIKNT